MNMCIFYRICIGLVESRPRKSSLALFSDNIGFVYFSLSILHLFVSTMSDVRNPHNFSEDEIGASISYAANKLGFVDGFREQQRTALKSFLRGHDLFLSLPTGFGKSAVFQAAPLCVDYLRQRRNGPNCPKAVAVVVMPLKSLVADQMSRAEQLGIISADLSHGLTDEIREGISSGKYSILFASPESVLEDDGREIFQLLQDQLCGFFIDESHCVTKWGSSSSDSKAFRSSYGRLGEIRAKVKAAIPTIAMTATATRETRKRIADSLGLRNFVVIKESPEKLNIKHTVYHTKTRDFDVMFRWLVQDLRNDGGNTSRMIIYCQSRRVVTEIYESFLANLPRTHQKHVNMFHSTTPDDVQHYIIDSFCRADGEVRVLIATIAYGMGIDVRGVSRAIICGHPTDLDDYVQMSGRIGRDGSPSIAATIKFPGDSVGRSTTSSMQDFLKGNRCRREALLEHFGEEPNRRNVARHSCCDVCAASCSCGESGCQERSTFESKLSDALSPSKSDGGDEFVLNIPTAMSVDKLQTSLESFRLSLLGDDAEHLYCGGDLSAGFSKAVVDKIVRECNVQFDFDRFKQRYAFPSEQLALDVWNLVEKTLERSSTTNVDQQAQLCSDSEEEMPPDEEDLEDEYRKAVIISDSDSD